jgi:hypothetical protein
MDVVRTIIVDLKEVNNSYRVIAEAGISKVPICDQSEMQDKNIPILKSERFTESLPNGCASLSFMSTVSKIFLSTSAGTNKLSHSPPPHSPQTGSETGHIS